MYYRGPLLEGGVGVCYTIIIKRNHLGPYTNLHTSPGRNLAARLWLQTRPGRMAIQSLDMLSHYSKALSFGVQGLGFIGFRV